MFNFMAFILSSKLTLNKFYVNYFKYFAVCGLFDRIASISGYQTEYQGNSTTQNILEANFLGLVEVLFLNLPGWTGKSHSDFGQVFTRAVHKHSKNIGAISKLYA